MWKFPLNLPVCIQPFRGRQHSRRRIYLKRKYCTIVTSQPSREDREIEKEKVALSFFFLTSDFCYFFFNISFFLFSLYKHVKSPVSLTQTHTHEKSPACVCVFVAFFIFCTGCVCVCVWGEVITGTHTCRYTHTHARAQICKHALSHTVKCTFSQTHTHTHRHTCSQVGVGSTRSSFARRVIPRVALRRTGGVNGG